MGPLGPLALGVGLEPPGVARVPPLRLAGADGAGLSRVRGLFSLEIWVAGIGPCAFHGAPAAPPGWTGHIPLWEGLGYRGSNGPVFLFNISLGRPVRGEKNGP